MKKFVLCSLILFTTTSFAQFSLVCKAYEFNEMTSMTKKELDNLYCQNNKTREAIYARVNTVPVSQLKAEVENTEACMVENERVMRAMRKLNANFKAPECK